MAELLAALREVQDRGRVLLGPVDGEGEGADQHDDAAGIGRVDGLDERFLFEVDRLAVDSLAAFAGEVHLGPAAGADGAVAHAEDGDVALAREIAQGSLRVTVGRDTSEADVDAFLGALPAVVERIRSVSAQPVAAR